MIKITPITLDNLPSINEDYILCLGFFDGLHLGHQELINKAKTFHLPVKLLTFSDETAGISSSRREHELLTPFPIKKSILESFGINEVFVLDFTIEVKNLRPEDFIKKILNPLHPKGVVVGDDYRFGCQALGDVDTLLSDKHATFKTAVVSRLKAPDGNFISARYLKELLLDGKIKKANRLFGRNYQLLGKVESGYGKGKTLGFPTANIALIPRSLLPKRGVYLVYLQMEGKRYQGIANIGIHPSINELVHPLLEVHLLNFTGDFYQAEVEVELLDYLRPEKKFASVALLKDAVNKDIAKAKEKFAQLND